MIKASYLITYRQSTPDRLNNLLFILRHLSKNDSIEVVLVEQDIKRKLPQSSLVDNCDYTLAFNDSVFNKSWGMNIAAERANHEYLIFGDADMLIRHDQLEKIISQFERGADAVNPYTFLVDFTQNESEKILGEGAYFDQIRNNDEHSLSLNSREQQLPFCGGIFAITASLFQRIAGMDERFQGWGAEDDAASHKIRCMAERPITFEQAIAYHLWHEKAYLSAQGRRHYCRNLAMLTAYIENPSDITELIAAADQTSNANLDRYRGSLQTQAQAPLISCVCVTRGRVKLLQKSIDCFLSQSYEQRELIIVCEADDLATVDFLSTLETPLIRSVIIPIEPKLSLGSLRNTSIEHALGEYICQWDDDDWYHPRRLEIQLKIAQKNQKAASILPRWLLYVTQTKQAYCSNIRLWEGSLLCKRVIFDTLKYPDQVKGEDSYVIKQLFIQDALAVEDHPDLYVYHFREANTWGDDHFKSIIDSSTKLSPAETLRLESMINIS